MGISGGLVLRPPVHVVGARSISFVDRVHPCWLTVLSSREFDEGKPNQRPTAYREALGKLLLSRSGRGAHAGAVIRG
jgi:hypothetical protein